MLVMVYIFIPFLTFHILFLTNLFILQYLNSIYPTVHAYLSNINLLNYNQFEGFPILCARYCKLNFKLS